MDYTQQLFGKADQLSTGAMCARACIVFITALIMLRIGSKRTFGNESAIDHLVVIMLGGMLSRIVTGAAAYFPVTAATFVILLVHRLLAWLCMKYPSMDAIIKGKKKLLYTNGQLQKHNMNKTLVSLEDITESIRLMINEDSMEKVQDIYIETCGQISVVKKQKASN